ncbi:MAG: preprotein translocase subunit YajC [Bacteroidales bacterium]|nr:preprotein translocase subunit YajC [Bacteroidales bacterium]
MNLMNMLLFASGNAQGQPSGSPVSMIIFIVLMIVIFYFFMIRPQQKKNKEAQRFRESLQKGDKIVTIGGVHGKIVEINDTTFVIESEGSRIKIEKSAVAQSVEDIAQQAK